MAEILKQRTALESHEKLNEKNTLKELEHALTDIEKGFGKHINTQGEERAKNLMINQSQEINNILISKYPDFFGKIQKAKWYDQGNAYSGQMSTLLDIVQFGTPNQKQYFIEMMESAENGEERKSLALYERYFIGTSIGNDINSCFEDSIFVSYIKKNALNTLNYHSKGASKKSIIYDNFQNNNVGKRIVQDVFKDIPTKYIHIFLSLLPEIEDLCAKNDLITLKQKIDALNIDPVFTEKFLYGINSLRSIGHEENRDNDMKYYSEMELYYLNKINVSKEKNDIISSQKEIDKKGGINFSIIKESFPGKDTDFLDEKNKRLARLLEKFIDEKGKITTEIKIFNEELLSIFKGSLLEKELICKDGGRAALGIIAKAAKEGAKQTEDSLKREDSTFSPEKLTQLKEKERKELIILLSSNQDVDTKIRVLRKQGITSKEFKNEEEKKSSYKRYKKL